MKRTALIVTMLTLITLSALSQEYKEGQVIVLIGERYAKSTFFSERKLNGRSEFRFVQEGGSRIFEKFNITKIERTFPEIRDQDTDPESEELKRYYTITGNFRRDKLLATLLREGGDFFEDAEPVSSRINTKLTPNDYLVSGSPNAALQLIQATSAWDITTGSSSVKIAVSDPSGFWLDHPDYVNPNLTNQMDYVHSSASDETPGGAHGLIVASVAAMSTNNGIGISSIGYNSKLMAFGASLGNMLIAARDFGAKVINASWSNTCNYSLCEQKMINKIHSYGAVIVVAAGNGNVDEQCSAYPDGYNSFQYPAAYENVMTVGSVDNYDSYFSGSIHHTFNSSVDVTAPGFFVRSASVNFHENLSFNEFAYSSQIGTSVAAPIVAGIAALVYSVAPDLTNKQVEKIIKGTTDNVNSVGSNSTFASVSGTGRVNAYSAVSFAKACFTCTDVSHYPTWITDEVSSWYGIPNSVYGCKVQINEYTTTFADDIEIVGSREVVLKPGFQTVSGTDLVVKIDSKCVAFNDTTTSSGARMQPMQHVTYRDRLESGEIKISEEDFFYEPYKSESFPNPATGYFILTYSLPNEGHVQIFLTNIHGEIVKSITDEFKREGDHEQRINISSLANGVYFYTIRVNDWSETKKVVVVN